MKDMFTYCLHLADNALIMGHRLSELCGHGPILEEDIATTNIALDHLGQARALYQYASTISTEEVLQTEDDMAYKRTEREFLNCILLEQENGHFGDTIMKQFLYNHFNILLYKRLGYSKNTFLSSFANKAIKEVQYHIKYSDNWVLRLGDGTEESHNNIQNSIDMLWEFVEELFYMTSYETVMSKDGVCPVVSELREEWKHNIERLFKTSTLEMPKIQVMPVCGKEGVHSEKLGYLLAEMQYLQHTYPNSLW